MLNAADVGGTEISAPVDFTSNVVNNQSGTIELRATFDNADFALVPGQLVNVVVQLNDIPNALIVPRDAINDGPDGPYLYVVVEGKAVQHHLQILFDDTKNVAIESDVKPGDKVIVEGQLRVEPNASVDILPAVGEAPPPAPDAGPKRGRNGGNRARPK
jgi:multidrug efflux system membrane fusion protein